jgi:hypothetical protein
MSRRTGESTANVKKEAALEELSHWLEKIKLGEISFADAAQARSDCSSYKNGGDLGPFGPGEMQKAFEDATYALDVGQISGTPPRSLARAAVALQRQSARARSRVLTARAYIPHPTIAPWFAYAHRATGIVETDSGLHLIHRTA